MSEHSPTEDTLELHSSHMQMELDEYDNNIRNQTIAEVLKIIDEVRKIEVYQPKENDPKEDRLLKLGYLTAIIKIKEEIKNLKVKE